MLVFEEGSLTIKLRDPESDFWETTTYDLVEKKEGFYLIEREMSCGYEKSFNPRGMRGPIRVNDDKKGWVKW